MNIHFCLQSFSLSQYRLQHYINTFRHRTSALRSFNQTALFLVSDIIHALMAFMLSAFFSLVIFP